MESTLLLSGRVVILLRAVSASHITPFPLPLEAGFFCRPLGRAALASSFATLQPPYQFPFHRQLNATDRKMVDEIDVCRFCADIIKATHDATTDSDPSPQPPSAQRPQAHHSTYGLLLSLSKTCLVCRLIVSLWPFLASELTKRGLSPEALEPIQRAYQLTITINETRRAQNGVRWAFLEANLESTETAFPFGSHFTVTTCSPTDPASAFPVWKGAAAAVTLDEKLATIQSWIHGCFREATHINCRPTPYAPLRLLAIDPESGPLRLVQRDTTTADQMKYAALTYCWGKSLQLRTTKGTLSRFCNEIPFELVPKTCTDAINMARAL